LEEIRKPKYLNDETSSKRDPLRYTEGKPEKKAAGLQKIYTNMYLVLEVLTVR
jgi:hypothetical protein